VKNALDVQLQQTIVLDYLKEEILSFVNNGTQRVFTLEYVAQNTILGNGKLTEDRLMHSFYLIETETGKRLSKMQKKLLLRGIDYEELSQQRDRMAYLIVHHPNMVIKELPKTSVPSAELLVIPDQPLHWRGFLTLSASLTAFIAMTGVFIVGLVDSVKYVASLFY
jgi:hypothetical protein